MILERRDSESEWERARDRERDNKDDKKIKKTSAFGYRYIPKARLSGFIQLINAVHFKHTQANACIHKSDQSGLKIIWFNW